MVPETLLRLRWEQKYIFPLFVQPNTAIVIPFSSVFEVHIYDVAVRLKKIIFEKFVSPNIEVHFLSFILFFCYMCVALWYDKNKYKVYIGIVS